MSKAMERVEIITGMHHRRRYTTAKKIQLVEQTMQPGMTVSAFAHLNDALATRHLPRSCATISGEATLADAEGGSR
jgi:transposase-like protein